MKYFLYPLIAILLLSCQQEESKCDKIVSIILENSLRKHKIDADQLKEICNCDFEEDEFINKILTLNNEPHTFYVRNGEFIYGSYSSDKSNTTGCYFTRPNIPDRVGYIKLEPLMIDINLSEEKTIDITSKYVRNIQKKIQEEDESELDAWLIDCSDNTGGNMWPMLVGLEPFYDQNILGHFELDQDTVIWRAEDGDIYYDDFNFTQKCCPTCKPYQLKNDVKIALLVSHRTGSSGEATAISLQSLDKTSVFGCQTSGFASGNSAFPIVENEHLLLTTSIMTNDENVSFPNGILPDYSCTNSKELEQVLEEWLVKI